jgi:signal transduction histidine kinase
LILSEKLQYKTGKTWAMLLIGVTNSIRNYVPQAISYFEKSIYLADSLHNYVIVSRALANIGWCVFDLEDYFRAIYYFKRSLDYQGELIGQDAYIITLEMNLAQCYLATNQLAEAENYLNKVQRKGEDKNPNVGYLLNLYSALRIGQGKYAQADSILQRGWEIITKLPDKIDKADNRFHFARLRLTQGKIQSAYDYAIEAKGYYQVIGSKVDLERIYKLLSTIESKRNQVDHALEYLIQSNAMRDSVHNYVGKYSEFLFNQREKESEIKLYQKQKELLQVKARNQQILWMNALFIFIVVIVALMLFTWQKEKTNNKLMALNEDLTQKEAAIALQNDQLRELNLSKDKLFSIIGHDLRGPLSSLKAFSSLLSRYSNNLDEDLKGILLDLDNSLKNLFRLLENLLDWSLSQTGRVEFIPEAFDIAATLRENEDLFHDQLKNKRIRLINESTEKLLVHAHPNSIGTVVRNLISNAIKFTHEGGTIILRAQRENGKATISVTDDGIGISKEEMQNLFKIGIRQSKPGTAKEKGSGLGLILCKDFVEKNQGTIGAESVEGKMTTFYFTVPLA